MDKDRQRERKTIGSIRRDKIKTGREREGERERGTHHVRKD